jgi:hypothetical protein
MGSKKKRGSLFGRTLSRGGAGAENHKRPANPSSKLYRTLDLPLDKFIVCVCEGDLAPLIISGEPTTEEVLEAWGEIFLDYMDSMRDNKARYKLDMEIKIQILDARLDQADTALLIMQTVIHPEAVATLQRLNLTDYNQELFDRMFAGDKDAYFEELNLIKNRSREFKIDRDLLTIELEEYVKSEELAEQKKADRSTFLNILSRIATYKHVALIRASEITTAEFVAMFNEYLDHINALKASKPTPKF